MTKLNLYIYYFHIITHFKMALNQHSIIALDLHNAILDNIETWFEAIDLKNSNLSKNLIRKFVNENVESHNPVEYVFLLNDIVFANTNKNNYCEIYFSEYLGNDLMLLQPVSLNQLEKYKSVIIDWIFNNHKKNELVFNAIQSFKITESEKYQFPNFTTNVCVIDVIDLGFKLNDFFMPLNQKFKAIHQFFMEEYQTTKVLKNVNLTRIFLADNLILGYAFQMEGNTQEHFFWNIHLNEHLLLMEKITFSTPIVFTVDNLLDKINMNGIESLNDNEMIFLSNQK